MSSGLPSCKVRIEFIDGILPSDDLVREPDPAVRADAGRSRNPACLHSIKRGAADRDDLQDLLFKTCFSRPALRSACGAARPHLHPRWSFLASPQSLAASHWRLPQSEYPVSGPGRCEARSRRETARLLPGSDFSAHFRASSTGRMNDLPQVICPSRLGKNSDYRAGVARSVTTANHSAILAWNAFKTSGIERRAEPRPLSRATRAFSAMYATKRSKPRMLSMRVKL
jgi:hypothetical protein